jgi:hypothetical protein
MNAVWKKLCLQFVHSFKHFEEDESFEDLANKIVKFAEGLELEVDTAVVKELPDARGAELTNEELMELEAAGDKVQENTSWR